VDKLERLLNLVAALLGAERPLSRNDLRERLPGAYSSIDDNFRRAFERDKDDLRSMGIPVLVEPIPGTDPPVDGYRIPPTLYGGDAPALEPDELAALHLATNLVRLAEAPVEDPFWKLGGAPSGADPAPVASLPDGEAIGPLLRAVAERRVAEFRYAEVARAVEPHRVVFNRGHWYMSGRDRTRDAGRRFRVDRIDGTIAVGPPGGYERPRRPVEIGEDPAWRYGTDEPVEARLAVDAAHVPWVIGHLGAESVVEHRDDGSVVVAEEVVDRAAFRSFVLAFLDGAEILAPEDLRDDLVVWLEAQR